jgi:hypothetical protein
VKRVSDQVSRSVLDSSLTAARSVCGPGSLSGKIVRLHRHFEQHFVALAARFADPALHVVRIGRKGERHLGGSPERGGRLPSR